MHSGRLGLGLNSTTTDLNEILKSSKKTKRQIILYYSEPNMKKWFEDLTKYF